MAYSPGTSYSNPSPTGMPGSSTNATQGYPGLNSTQESLTVPAEQGSTTASVGQRMAAFVSLDPSSQNNLADMLWQADMFPDTLYKSHSSPSPSDIETAMGKALVLAAQAGKPVSQVLADRIQQFQAQGGAGQYPGSTLRTLGLGKYPLFFTNPADVQKAADDVVTALLGRRATAGEISTIGGILHSEEAAQRGGEFQQYLGQQLASAQLWHGGVAQPKTYSLGDIQYAIGGQAAVTGQAPGSTAPVGAPPGAPGAAGYIDATGNYVPPANVAAKAPPVPGGAIVAGGGNIAQPAPTPAASTVAPPINAPSNVLGQAAGPTSGPTAPVTGVPTTQITTPQQLAQIGLGPPSQGTQTVVLGDGTVVVLPQQYQATAAASPTDAAYSYVMANYQPEIRGRTAAAALQAMSAALGAGVK